LSDEALRGLVLEPGDDNTQLLYENTELGIRFLYPRRWRVAGVEGRQVTLEDRRGNGILLTAEPVERMPSGQQFLSETRTWLTQQKATIVRADNPQPVPGANLEHFAIEADVNRQRLALDYYVARQSAGGATVAARLVPADAATLR